MLDRVTEASETTFAQPSHVQGDASSDARQEALAIALHDLANAMSIVHGTIQLWRTGARLHATPSEDWASVHNASDRAVRLSRELLDLCRYQHSRFQLDRRPMELVDAVLRVVNRRRPGFEAAGQWLWAEVPDEPVWISADADQVERVLENLLDNSAKYTGAGGHITVGIETGTNHAVIRVRDTGIGISSEFLGRVFHPFVRENSAGVRLQAGSGVGLLAVQRIVEMHGGCVEALSPGRNLGSEFIVRLPISAGIGPRHDASVPFV